MERSPVREGDVSVIAHPGAVAPDRGMQVLEYAVAALALAAAALLAFLR